MKRTKLMLGVAALSAALLGTGYAAMTDLLTIEGTVSTANFDVNFGKSKLQVGDIVCTDNNYKTELRDKYNINVAEVTSNQDDGIQIAVGPLLPGVPVTYTTTMQNDSNIDAQLKNIILSDGKENAADNEDLYKYMEVELVLMNNEKVEYTKTGTLNDFKDEVVPDAPIILQGKLEKKSEEESEVIVDDLELRLTLKLKELSGEAMQDIYKKSADLKLMMNFDWQQRANQ